MTPRSPSPPDPKTATISPRLRYRAGHDWSIQPPEIPRIRNSRPNRAATLPEPHRDPLDVERQQARQLLRGLRHSGTLESADTGLQVQSTDSPRQSVELHLYASPPGSTTLTNPAGSLSYHPRTRFPICEFPPSPLASVSGSLDFDLPSSVTDPQQPHSPYVDLQAMSTLGFVMAPAQYGMGHYGSAPAYPQSYATSSQHGYIEQRSSTSGPYDSTYASGSVHLHDQRRSDGQNLFPSHQAHAQAPLQSPYQQQPLHAVRSGSTPLASTPGYGYTPPHSSSPSHQLPSTASSYPPPQLYPPASYGVNDYQPLPAMYSHSSNTPAAYPSYGSSAVIPQPPLDEIPVHSPSSSAHNNAVGPRILNARPKPQCWEHGCNGRQFSTFSNLLRHQREKSGTASKSYCPRCGAEFTRSTARNGHMAHDKCKARRPSESSH